MCLASTNTEWAFSPNDTQEVIEHFDLKMGIIFSIDKVQLKDDGYYFCYGGDMDTKRLFISRAQLKVYGKLLSYL